MVFYELQIKVEEMRDGGDYRFLATSPDLPNLIVAGDTAEEVLALAPQVASALITSMKAAGNSLPETQCLPHIPLRELTAHPTGVADAPTPRSRQRPKRPFPPVRR
jgi:predicted RNase H-like HicB family nuclease